MFRWNWQSIESASAKASLFFISVLTSRSLPRISAHFFNFSMRLCVGTCTWHQFDSFRFFFVVFSSSSFLSGNFTERKKISLKNTGVIMNTVIVCECETIEMCSSTSFGSKCSTQLFNNSEIVRIFRREVATEHRHHIKIIFHSN